MATKLFKFGSYFFCLKLSTIMHPLPKIPSFLIYYVSLTSKLLAFPLIVGPWHKRKRVGNMIMKQEKTCFRAPEDKDCSTIVPSSGIVGQYAN